MVLFKARKAQRRAEWNAKHVVIDGHAYDRAAKAAADERAANQARWATYETDEATGAEANESSFDAAHYLASGEYAAALAKYNARSVDRPARRVAAAKLSRRYTQTLYRHFDRTGRLLYVGITQRQDRRATEHSNKPWWGQVFTTAYEHFDTRPEVEEAERRAILDEQPRFNKRGKNTR